MKPSKNFARNTPPSNTGYDLRFLTDSGAIYAKQKDLYGDIRRGWWLDHVFLGESASDAIRAITGD